MQNLQKFLSKVERLKEKIGVSKKSCWYRGQSKPWPLDCSLARFYTQNRILKILDANASENPALPIHPIEDSLFCDYVHQASESSDFSRNSWDVLASMQHYGVPTRLLDWSESFLVACYFALEHSFDANKGILKDGFDPTIYFLNPYRLSSASVKSASSNLPEALFQDPAKIWNISLSKEFDYLENFISRKTWQFNSPIPIYPPKTNGRIVAQQGCFTFHGLSLLPLDKQHSSRNALVTVSIREHRVARELWQVIQLHNITEYYIYRDRDRLGSHLRRRHQPHP